MLELAHQTFFVRFLLKRIEPILLRPTALDETPVQKPRVLPSNDWASTWNERDTVFAEIAGKIRALLQQRLAQK